MKTRGIIAAAITLSALLAVSCKKDYKCACTITTNDPYRNENVIKVETNNVYNTRNNAKAKCESQSQALDTTAYMYVQCQLQ